MDTKKFSGFVLAIGLLFLGWGVVQFATNQPVQARQQQTNDFMGAINNMGNSIQAMSENAQRASRRKGAGGLLLIGGVVSVIGFGLQRSAKS